MADEAKPSNGIVFANPTSHVMFRAGLLVAREAIAREIERNGDRELADAIRKIWWPALLGDDQDPGGPRLLNPEEVATITDDKRLVVKEGLTASVEALPLAHVFLEKLADVYGLPRERKG